MKDNYFYFDDKYRKLQAEKTRMAWQLGLHEGKRARVEERKCKKIDCNNLFKVKYFDPKQFCSQSCAAVVNNTGQRRRKVTNCLNCGKETPRSTYKYCC